MNKEIISVTGGSFSTGGTFMDWSILFLSGKNHFFNSKHNCLELLTNDPVTAINAHGHRKNHPTGFELTHQHVETFKQSPHEMLTLYPYLLPHEIAIQDLNIPIDCLDNQEINQEVENYRFRDFSKLINYLLDYEAKLIYIDQNDPMLNLEPRSFSKMFLEPGGATSIADLTNKVQSVYFSKSIKQWQDLGLDQIWDIRERIALDTRPLQILSKPALDFSRPHLYLDSRDWIANGTTTIKRVMDFCKLPIDKSRWDYWVSVYHKWQMIHHPTLNFSHQLPRIISSIVNNWYHEIDLTFTQEIVVQHCLIYQHNLNLKTWKLEKFPDNTQKLHELLETNIHPIARIY